MYFSASIIALSKSLSLSDSSNTDQRLIRSVILEHTVSEEKRVMALEIERYGIQPFSILSHLSVEQSSFVRTCEGTNSEKEVRGVHYTSSSHIAVNSECRNNGQGL